MNTPVMPDSVPLLITYTIFEDIHAFKKTERADVAWSELVERIRAAPIYISKSSCPLISMAEYGEQPSEIGCLRYAGNVGRVFGCEFDYDGEQIAPSVAAEILQAENIVCVIYTSPSHKPNAPRWRILFPFSEPYIPEKRAEYLARANRVLGGIASRESFTLSQSFYLGHVRGAEYLVFETHGACIDLRADIAPLYGGPSREVPEPRLSDDQLRAAFVLGDGRYEAMLKLSSRWAAKGMAADDIESALLDLLGPGSLNADGIDLASRVRAAAGSAVRKFGGRRPQAAQERPGPSPQPNGQPEDGAPPWRPHAPPTGAWRPVPTPAANADVSVHDFYSYMPTRAFLFTPTRELWPPASVT
ncbi:MAG: hypothetical protein ACRD1F_09545, partial [Terriglobales bacterium]